MTEHSSASIRPPKDWQDFERNSRILFECILNDIHVQMNGRTGQAQHGVDIYGRKDGQGRSWIGVQCKGKDAEYGGSVTEKELRTEVEKTRNFTPALSQFFLITTSPVNAAIQTVARQITEEREQEGNPLSVSVWGWGELETRISQHPQALQAFHPDATPYSNQTLKNTEYLVNNSDAQTDMLNSVTKMLQGIQQSVLSDGTSAAMEAFDKSLHAEIDGYRDLINEGKPLTALRFLEGLEARIWGSATDRIKFRIITNIASSKLHISKEKEHESATQFLEAIAYQPDDKIGLANVALAYLLNGELQKAVEAVKVALDKYPENEVAASYLIQAHVKDLTIGNPTELVSENIRQAVSVDIACINFYRTRNDSRWVDLAKDACERHPDNERVIRLAAEAELDIVLTTKGFLAGQRPVIAIDKDGLRQAAAVLQKLWDKQYASEIPHEDYSLPYNLTQAYRAIGDKTAAKGVITQAIEKISDAPDIIRLRASFHLDDNQPDMALALLRKNLLDPESILLSGEIIRRNDPAAALALLEAFEEIQGLEHHHRVMAGHLRVDCLLAHPGLSKEERLKRAIEQSSTLLQHYPDNPLVLLLHSQVLEESGDDAGAKQALNDAKGLLKPSSIFFERLMLARKFEELKSYADAADILDGYVDASHDSPALRTLFFALINCDRRRQAHELLRGIPADVAEQPIYLRAAIQLHLRRGDYSSAETAINVLLNINPNDLSTHLNKVDIWLRRRDDEAIRRFLSISIDHLEGQPDERMRLAHLLARYGFYERALLLGYKTHLENSKNPEVSLAYIGLLLQPGSSDKINLQRTTIGPDVAFSIKNPLGDTATFIIEDDDSLHLVDETVASNHQFAVAATGLKEGDRFRVRDEEWVVTSVKHKFLYLLHSKMDSFELHFPDSGGLQRVRIQKDEDGNDSFESLLKKIKEKHDTAEILLDTYTKSPLPLELYAPYLGTDVIELWHGLSQTGRKFKVCNGIVSERVEAAKCIVENNKAGCVVDALTLHIIRVLGIEEAVAEICGPISATESTIDTFRQRREQIQFHGGQSFMTIHWQDGQYFREEKTKEQLENALANINRELDWIDQSVTILPAESSVPVSDEAGRIGDAISLSFLDPMLAAQAAGKILLCEDQSSRQFGAVEFKIKTSWLQPVLMTALVQDIITQEKYCETICALCEAGHSFISIDTSILLYALSKGEDKFEMVAKALFGVDAEFTSHLKVLVECLNSFWVRTWHSLQTKKATSVLLRRIFSGEWRHNIPDATPEYIAHRIHELFDDKHFIRFLALWLRGHFLINFDATLSPVEPKDKSKY